MSIILLNKYSNPGPIPQTTDDLPEGSSNLYFTDERSQDAVGTILVNSSSVSLTYNDGVPSITATVINSGVDHNQLLNYDANRHFLESDISHLNIQDIGTNTHGQIDTHIADATIHFTEGSISHLNIGDIGTNTHGQIDTHISDSTIHFTEGSISHLNIQDIGTNSHTTIDTHILDATIHFTEASIDHTAILNIGTNSHSSIDTHISDATIHFTVASIDHGLLLGLSDDDHTQYHNDSRALTWLGTRSTSDLPEGTNLYYTDARAIAALVPHTSDTSIHFTVGSIDHGSISGLGDDDHLQYGLLAGRSGGQNFIGGTGSGDDLLFNSTSNATKGLIGFGNLTDGVIYDEVNKRLGIGLSVPLTALHIGTAIGSLSTGLSFGSGVTGIYEATPNQLIFVTNNIKSWRIFGNTLGAIDADGPIFQGLASSSTIPRIIINRSFTSTGIGSRSDNIMSLIAGGINIMDITATGVVVNDDGADIDFRVEAVGQTHALYVDGTTGNVGINTGTPSQQLSIVGDVAITASTTASIVQTATAGTNGVYNKFVNYGGEVRYGVQNVGGTTYGSGLAYSAFMTTTGNRSMQFGTNSLFRMTILNNGNIGIGTVTPTAQLHTTDTVRFSGLTEDFFGRRMVVSDTLGNIDYRDLENPISLTDAPFGQYVINTPNLNNVLFASEKRYTVTRVGFDILYPNRLFNNNYDDVGGRITTDDAVSTTNIELITKGEFGSNGLTYSYGWVYVHFYSYYWTESVRVRLKTKNSSGTFEWRDWVVGTNISNRSNTRVMKIPLFGNYYCSEIEVEITADQINGSGTKEVWVSEIEFIVTRSVLDYAQPLMSKHKANSVYSEMTFRDSSNVAQVTIDSTGISGRSSLDWDGSAIFNESGSDVDFRVEGVGQPNALFVQGSDGFVMLGGNTPTAQLHTTKGRIVGTNRYTTNQTLDADDHVVFCNTDAASWSLSLPIGVVGTEYLITNSGSSSNNLTIVPNGTEKINGNSNIVLADKDSVTFIYNATDGWRKF